MSRMELAREEEKAISALQRVARKWPKTLWLFSASGSLHVMKKDETGNRVTTERGGVDQRYAVTVVNIENDGGDW